MGLTKNLGWLSKYITADSSGQIGIGCTPVEKFHVNSGAGNVPALFESTDPIAVAQFKDNNSTGFNAVGGQTNDLIFYSNNNINMRLDSSGYLGIGSAATSPKERLEISGLTGNIRIYGRSGIAQNQITSNVYYNGSAWTRDTSAGAVAIGLDASNGVLQFYTTSSTSGFPNERMRIFANGNIFIGSTPTDNGSRLQVDGGATFVGTTTVSYPDQGGARFKIVNSAGATSSGYGLIAGVSGTTQDGFSIYDYTNSATRLVITRYGTLGLGGNEDVNNTYTDKISIGHLLGSYGWIQTWNATSLYLNKAGNAVYAGTQRIDNNSDERIKENIVPIENALNTVLLLQGKKYNMLDEDNILRYGFIAQEVQPHLSDFVTESDRSFEKDDVKIENLLTLESSGAAWAALLVEAIKELTERIKTLENK